jgi:hypothetical protein
MPEAFAQLGQVFSGPGGLGNILKTALTGAGLVGNIMTQQKQNAALNRINYYQKNPAAAAQVIRSLTQPLSQGLTQDVGNNVQGYLGERGLSQSPNITAEVLSQSLAPYQQQNQQTAMQEFMNLLNPANARYGTPSDLSSLFSLWKPAPATGAGPASGGGGNAPTPPFVPQGTDVQSDSPIDIYGGYSGGGVNS